jgi:tetratricopeptide (TPR) repeat protein
MQSSRPKGKKKARNGRRQTKADKQSLWSQDRVCFWAICGAALLVRFFYLAQIQSIPLFYNLAGDGRTYDEWAQRIAAGDWLGSGVFYQAPLYPYFLGVLQTALGHNLWLIRLVQITLGALACGLIYRIGVRLFSKSAGIAAGLILALYAPAIFFDGLIEKSILDLLLVSALVLVIYCFDDARYWLKWSAAGVLLGLFALSRENALILILIVPLWIAFSTRERPLAMRASWTALFFAGLMVILLPVGLRNLRVGGEFQLTTSQLGANFFIGNNPAADGTYGSVRKVIGEPHLEGADAERLAERALAHALKPGEVSNYWLGQSWNFISTQPIDWLRLLGRKWLLVWNSREIEDSDDFYIYQQWSWILKVLAAVNHFGVIVPLAAVGVFFSLKHWRRLWLLYAIILALAVSVTTFYVFGRYRFPLVPLLALFAGAGVTELLVSMKKHNWQSLRTITPILLFTAVAVNWPVSNISGPGPGGYNNLSNAYDKQGRVNEAISAAQKAIAVDPSYGIAHYNLGNLYARQGNFALARKHFEEAQRIYPNYADVRSNLGQVLAESGDVQAAMQQFRNAIELNPSVSRAHLNLGVLLAKQGDLTEAIAPLQRAAELNPGSAESRYYLGSVYAAQGKYGEALIWFEDALRIEPEFAQAHQSLAQILVSQGRKEEAARHYQQAIRILKQRG